ncbi:MAG: amidotransferase [Alphaproteobacteria bacterium CG_4_10_14_0_2_um_filter_63_37]|nr:MAG: hypothetical protein AUJ55_00620 [Proteobacteria bacterium CG1_02_64_396]PJA23977.1 MAG: amidotransferase [Alphaproteobacteria bacterium CG_4_10_14_0_2_um_filter_63_37]
MTLTVLQHVPFEGPAAIADWAQSRGVEVQIVRMDQNQSLPDPESVEGLVVMGGPMGVGDGDQYPWIDPEREWIGRVLKRGVPTLGICLGGQLMAAALGGQVTRNQEKEIGWFPIERTQEGQEEAVAPWNPLLPERLIPLHWHGETFSIPEGATRLYQSAGCDNQAFAWGGCALALQFHLESTQASVADLLKHAKADLAEPGPFVASAQAILEERVQHEPVNLALLEQLCDALFLGSPPP